MEDSDEEYLQTYCDPPLWTCYENPGVHGEMLGLSERICQEHQRSLEEAFDEAILARAETLKRFEHRVRLILMAYGKEPKPGIFWITINPDPALITVENFIAKINKLVQRSCFSKPIYAFEQTGTTEADIGHHPHVHIMCDKTIDLSPAQMQKYIYSSCHHFVGDKKAIHVQTFPASFREDKEAYLKGLKWDEKKDPASVMNLKWRYNLGIPNVYSYK